MIAALLISGLGETSSSFGQGMQPLAERLRDELRIDVTRFGYWQTEEAIEHAKGFANVALVGHSFGGDAAAEVSWHLDRGVIVFGVDPVPRSFFARMKSSIAIPDHVRARCLRRSRGWYPFSKWFDGVNVVNATGDGDHKEIMRSLATHNEIVDFVGSLA